MPTAAAGTLHFVEVMACPQACINGGGQIRPSKGTTGETWTSKVRAAMDSRESRTPESNSAALALLNSPAWQPQYALTDFHAREKPTNPLALKW